MIMWWYCIIMESELCVIHLCERDGEEIFPDYIVMLLCHSCGHLYQLFENTDNQPAMIARFEIRYWCILLKEFSSCLRKWCTISKDIILDFYMCVWCGTL